MRWLVAFLVTGFEGKYNIKERAFMAFAWIPKATVQAALSSSILAMTASMTGMTDEDREDFNRYGLIILTTAVLAVILSAPAGAILINSLGMLFLPYDGDDPEILA